jgi:hypothetical protein
MALTRPAASYSFAALQVTLNFVWTARLAPSGAMRGLQEGVAMKYVFGIVIVIAGAIINSAVPAAARTCSSFVPDCKRIVSERCKATNCTAWQRDYAPADCDRYQQQCVASGIWQGPPSTVRGVEKR